MDVDAVVRPFDGWRTGRRAEETGKAWGQREQERDRFYLSRICLTFKYS